MAMKDIEDLLKEIRAKKKQVDKLEFAIADNDEPDYGHGFPKIKDLATKAIAALRVKFCPFCGHRIKEKPNE